MDDGAHLLIHLPLWLSVLLVAFVLAEGRYRALLQTAGAWFAYAVGATALLPRDLAQVALSCSGWILVALLLCSLLAPRSNPAGTARLPG